MQTLPASRGVTAHPVELPSPPGALDIHAFSRPARDFTGDFYFTHRRGEHLWFALGDVAGKGLDAAVVMALIQEELERLIASCARTACSPATTLARLHQSLRPLLPSNRFATVIIGSLRDDGTLMIANGGHCPALIVRASGAVERIGPTGPVAGLIDGSWSAARTTLGEGETLVLFSDGLVEGPSCDGEEFGLDRVTALVEEGGGARELTRRLVQAFDAHNERGRDDDLTILAIAR